MENTEQVRDSYLDCAEMTYLSPENCELYRTQNGFPAMKAFLPPRHDDLVEEAETDRTPVRQDFGRVFFHRAFPFDAPDRYISVLDGEGTEYGMIRALSEFENKPDMLEIIRTELDRKYLIRTILKIRSLKDKLGFSYWDVDTDCGRFSFTMQDTYRNLIHNSENGIILSDVDGNRFQIPDVLALDPRSYRKIELYL
ncbi:MAG: DUF1854 domain-containing protein [Clostridia bacterium]|nr:DUF1854 domain-containing protein [Clostridia bacterium]